jgi:hypothetical protein
MAVEFEYNESVLTPIHVLYEPFEIDRALLLPKEVFPVPVLKVVVDPDPIAVLSPPVVQFAKAEFPIPQFCDPLVTLFKQVWPNEVFEVPVISPL